MPVAGEAAGLVKSLDEFITREVELNGGSTRVIKPAHRVKFLWPPHPVSYSFHLLASDWAGSTTFDAHGESPVDAEGMDHRPQCHLAHSKVVSRK